MYWDRLDLDNCSITFLRYRCIDGFYLKRFLVGDAQICYWQYKWREILTSLMFAGFWFSIPIFIVWDQYLALLCGDGYRWLSALIGGKVPVPCSCQVAHALFNAIKHSVPRQLLSTDCMPCITFPKSILMQNVLLLKTLWDNFHI